MSLLRRCMLIAGLSLLLLPGCAGPGTGATGVRQSLLQPNKNGRLVDRTMRPRYITIHSTSNLNATAGNHATLLSRKGIRSKHNPRFGRSGWVTWHYTVDDRETVQHLHPTEQGDHADYGGPGDTASIGVEICEFRSAARQAAALDRAARLTAQLANRYRIPTRNIVPHKHWPRWDFKHGKPCPRILLERDPSSPDGKGLGPKWRAFIAKVERHR